MAKMPSLELTDKFIKGLKNYNLTYDEIKNNNWKYCGGRIGCLIQGTIPSQTEVNLLNECLNSMKDRKIIVYGKNNNDEKLFNKYQQLIGLGFTNIHIYIGGLFEWLLLQEVYGDEQFPTTCTELDILKYK